MKFIIIAIILAITYILLGALMKAAGKVTPSIPTINHKEDN
ncbi:hypothetical protein [Clostridium sp.]|nr:hypothetical protein [Clostridium sp.]